jgi:hypothetical protein
MTPSRKRKTEREIKQWKKRSQAAESQLQVLQPVLRRLESQVVLLTNAVQRRKKTTKAMRTKTAATARRSRRRSVQAHTVLPVSGPESGDQSSKDSEANHATEGEKIHGRSNR